MSQDPQCLRPTKSPLVLLLLLVLPTGNILQYPDQTQKVKITAVDYPTKVFALQPFEVVVFLHSFQAGGYIRVSFNSGAVSIANATTGLLLALGGSDTSVSIPFQLPYASQKPYEFVLLAFWDAMLGGETLEDTCPIAIQSVIITLRITGVSPSQPVMSDSPFNVTFTIENNGTDVAYDASAQLTDRAGFGVLQNGTVNVGDIAPNQSKNVTFTIVSNAYDVVPQERRLTLTVSFFDWTESAHSQTATLSVYLQVSWSTIRLWTPVGITVLVILIATILIALRRIRSFRVGPDGVTVRR